MMNKKFSGWLKPRRLLSTLLLAAVVTMVVDVIRIKSYKPYPILPARRIECEQDQIYYELSNNADPIDWQRLTGTLDYIRGQYDCADFRLVNLIRILYRFGDRIPEAMLSEIEQTLFDFRYWWDEPGGNSMCYWTENHQILFASAEYLVGQQYPDVIFSSGLTGREHMEKARKRALSWLAMRWDHGFSEFNSSVYYKEDVGALINLIDFAGDEELVIKSKIIMDLLFYDVASQSVGTLFVSASTRAYARNRTGRSGARMGGLAEYYWGSGATIRRGIMYGMMTTTNYTLPPVLARIARDRNAVVMKHSFGLDVPELKEEGRSYDDDAGLMLQLGAGAFSNPEVVRNSLAFVRKNRMFSNGFLKDFKMLDYTLLRLLHLEPAAVRLVHPRSNGNAMQRGNIYTYRTGDYSLFSVQNHHPGAYGSQHHVAGMNIAGAFSIFHTHPSSESKKAGYWIGYGYLPHVAQDRNVSLAVYGGPVKQGLERPRFPDYTYAYFPAGKFDAVEISGTYAFGRKGDTYCALIARNPLEYKDEKRDDLVQAGAETFWITEAGSRREDGSFKAFMDRILNNRLSYDADARQLHYRSRERDYMLTFLGDFVLDGEVVNLVYERYESPYCRASRKPSSLLFECNGKSLQLDFHNMKRVFNRYTDSDKPRIDTNEH